MQSENNNPYQIDDVKPKSLNAKFAAGAVTFSIGAIALSQLFNPALAQALVGSFGQPVQSDTQTVLAETSGKAQVQPSSTSALTSTNSTATFTNGITSGDDGYSSGRVLVAEVHSAQNQNSLADAAVVATSGVTAPKVTTQPSLSSITLPSASNQGASNLSSATPYGSNANGGSQASGGSAAGSKSSGKTSSRLVGNHESEDGHYSKASDRHEHESDDDDDEGEDD